MNWRRVALIGGVVFLAALAGCQYAGEFSMDPVTADSTVVEHEYTERKDLDTDQQRILWDATTGGATVRASEHPFAHEDGPYLVEESLYDLDVETANETTTTVVELRLTVEDVTTESPPDRNATTAPERNGSETSSSTATATSTETPTATATVTENTTATTDSEGTASNESATATTATEATASNETATVSDESATDTNDTATATVSNETATSTNDTATATSTETPTETRRTETTTTATRRNATETTTPATTTAPTAEPPSGRAFDHLPAVDRSKLPGDRLRALDRELDNGTRTKWLPLSERRVQRGDDVWIFFQFEYNASELSRSALVGDDRISRVLIGGRPFEVDVQRTYERTERTYHIDGSVVATDPGDHLIEAHRDEILVLDDLSPEERRFVEQSIDGSVSLESETNATFEALRSRFESADPLWPDEYEEYYLVEYEGEVYQARMEPSVQYGDGYGY